MANKVIISYFVVCSIITVIICVKLPPYFTRCRVKDPNLNECVLNNAKNNWPTFAEGDKYYHIQNMNPLSVKLMTVRVDSNLHGNLTNGHIYSMNTFKIISANVDMENKHWEFEYTFENCLMNGTYDVAGRLFGLPITGTGITNVTFVGGKYKFKIDYELNDKNGKQYIHITNANIIILEKGKIIFQIHFDRNNIGEALADALTNSWQDLGPEITDSFSNALGKLVSTILNQFFERVPYEELFILN